MTALDKAHLMVCPFPVPEVNFRSKIAKTRFSSSFFAVFLASTSVGGQSGSRMVYGWKGVFKSYLLHFKATFYAAWFRF